MGVKQVRVKAEFDGATLASLLKGITNASAGVIKAALDLGACSVNGKLERFASHSLKEGDKVAFDPEFKTRLQANTSTKPATLYEDDDLLIINKGAGLASEKEQIAPFFSFPITLVHRLDKRTTGALCLAKHAKAAKAMERLFKERQVHKTYLAISCGQFQKEQGTIRTCLVADKKLAGQTLYRSVARDGYTNATTHFQTAKGKKKGFTPVWCRIETGKTHQIRVHLKEAGHPIVGDLLYVSWTKFPLEVKNMLLHAYKLSFTHPITESTVEVKAPIPTYFKPFL